MKKPRLQLDDFLKEISLRTGVPLKQAHAVVDCMFEVIQDCIIEGVELNLPSVGLFTYVETLPQKDVPVKNPYTGETTIRDTKGHRIIKFKPSSVYKEYIKQQTETSISDLLDGDFGADEEDDDAEE